MEPSIIDYYNYYPKIIEVIDKLNEETQSLQIENDKIKQEILYISDKYSRELKEYKKMNELKLILLEIKNKKKKKKRQFHCF
jgi:hypothetical protein